MIYWWQDWRKFMQKIIEKASKIKLVIFDVDGVLTDRKIYFADSGHEYKAFNAHDGFGIKMLMKSGVEVGIITARNSPVVLKRMQELGVKHIYQGYDDKMSALQVLIANLEIAMHQVAYVGDDLPDLPIMRRVGLGIAVADAAAFVQENADWCTHASGGRGAAREACEMIMRAQNTYQQACEQYL